MVLGARPNRRAMAESSVPCARPRLTSSRSAEESRRYCVVVRIRIHRTHIRCVKCLTPSREYTSGFSGPAASHLAHLLRLVTKAMSDRLLDDRKKCPPKKTQRSKTKRPPPAPRGCSNVSLRQRIAAQDVRLQP